MLRCQDLGLALESSCKRLQSWNESHPEPIRNSGATQPMSKLREVAALAGVSAATVSRTLSVPHLVNARTRERVEQAIAKLDYLPNGAARALKSNRTGSIGAVIPALNNELYAAGIDALQGVLEGHGYTLLVTSYRYDSSVELDAVRSLLQRGVDGLMLVGRQHDAGLYDQIARRDVPYVLTWAADGVVDRPAIGYSNQAASARLARHLLALGHRRFAMISGPLARSDRARDRVTGVRDELARDGLALRPTHLLETSYSVAGGREAMQRLLGLRPRPTAVICGNDLIAAAAIATCHDAAVTVPADLSIAGFGSMDALSLQRPTLTTIRSPIAAIGAAAGEELIARIEGRPSRDRVEFIAELVIGQSTGPVPAPRRRPRQRG